MPARRTSGVLVGYPFTESLWRHAMRKPARSCPGYRLPLVVARCARAPACPPGETGGGAVWHVKSTAMRGKPTTYPQPAIVTRSGWHPGRYGSVGLPDGAVRRRDWAWPDAADRYMMTGSETGGALENPLASRFFRSLCSSEPSDDDRCPRSAVVSACRHPRTGERDGGGVTCPDPGRHDPVAVCCRRRRQRTARWHGHRADAARAVHVAGVRGRTQHGVRLSGRRLRSR